MKFGADVVESRKRKHSAVDAKLRQENAALKVRNRALMEENDRKHAESVSLAREFEAANGAEPDTKIARLIAAINGDDDQDPRDCNVDEEVEED